MCKCFIGELCINIPQKLTSYLPVFKTKVIGLQIIIKFKIIQKLFLSFR